MKLIPLRCPTCADPLKPEEKDVLVACANCRTPVHLSQRGVRAANVSFAAPRPGAEPTHWLPMWVFYGTVSLEQRTTQGRQSREGEAEAFWADPRRFYVPAWEVSVHLAREMGTALLQAQPRYRTVSQPGQLPLVPAKVTAEDARKLVEFIVLDVEVKRDDWLRTIRFSLDVNEPVLWAVPAGRENDAWRLLPLTDSR